MKDNSHYRSDQWLTYLRKTDRELLNLARMDVFKGSGRGGQKRNKTSNAIRLTLSYLSVIETSSRSRATNIEKAVKKLRMAIASDLSNALTHRCHFQNFPEEIKPYLFKKTIRINASNPAYPFFIGCMLDVYIKNKGNWIDTANEYKITRSQLNRFIKKNICLKEPLKKLQGELGGLLF